jgi:predicted DNA-binding transcriptional regulator AlpA
MDRRVGSKGRFASASFVEEPMSSTERVATASAKEVFVTARQLAIMLQVSTTTLWKLRAAGVVPSPARLSGRTRWRLRDVIHLIDDGGQEAS